MPKSKVITLVWIDTKGAKPKLDHETFEDEKIAGLRLAALAKEGIERVSVDGNILQTEIDVTPRVTFIGTKPKAKRKPRAPKAKPAEAPATSAPAGTVFNADGSKAEVANA
jgi:hypothetical protein